MVVHLCTSSPFDNTINPFYHGTGAGFPFEATAQEEVVDLYFANIFERVIICCSNFHIYADPPLSFLTIQNQFLLGFGFCWLFGQHLHIM